MMHKCFHYLLNVLMLSGLVILGSNVQAESFTQPKTLFYGLNVTNFSATLLQQGVDGKLTTYTRSTLDTPEFFGDPPTIANNDSPAIFITLLLSDTEISELRARDQAFANKYGEQLQRELYISAAGFDAAKNQRLDALVDPAHDSSTTWAIRLRKAITDSHMERHLQISPADFARLDSTGGFNTPGAETITTCVNDWAQGQTPSPDTAAILTTLAKHGCLAQSGSDGIKACASKVAQKIERYKQENQRVTLPVKSVAGALDEFGCFNESTKAEFYVCTVRWVMEARAGIKFDRSEIIIEQDNQAMSAMADNLMKERQLSNGRYFILQATTLAQPYLNTNKGLLNTPSWMGGTLPYDGGTFQAGTLAISQLGQKLHGSTVMEYMSSPASGLFFAIGSYFNQSLADGSIYIGGGKLLDDTDVYTRVLNTATGRSFTKNQVGTLLLNIADPGTRSDLQTYAHLSDEQMQQALSQASAILSQVRDQGALSLALFMSLFEPSFQGGASLVIVG